MVWRVILDCHLTTKPTFAFLNTYFILSLALYDSFIAHLWGGCHLSEHVATHLFCIYGVLATSKNRLRLMYFAFTECPPQLRTREVFFFLFALPITLNRACGTGVGAHAARSSWITRIDAHIVLCCGLRHSVVCLRFS